MDTLHYFRSYKDYFWQWEEGGEVMAIPNGSTICYREQLVSILSQLAHYGLPSLGSVVLVLSALNPEPEEMYALLESVGKKQNQAEMAEQSVRLLKLLASLPPQYKKGVGKLELLRALFKGAHRNISRETSNDILNEFRQIRFNGEIYTHKAEQSRHTIYNDLRPFSMLAEKFFTIDDIKRAISGLPDTSETEIDLETEKAAEPEKPKDFVDQLMERDQTFPVGSLVRRIWSGLNIPFHNVVPSEQPMGGVSDITNKGDFHRLLTSEFAHDDVMFLSRLANNEALYINREVPPQSNEKERVILIDVSIRNWGTPKTIAYALLIAIAKHPKTDIPCSAYVVGDTYRQISFASVDEIIAAMQELEGCMHPGKGIRKFMDDFRRKKNMELFVITNPETLKMPGLAVAVQDDLPLFRFWLVADQEGEVDVYRNQKNSRKHHQHFKLPLEELWSQRRPRRQVSSHIPEPPADSNYPILFPGCPNGKKMLIAPDGAAYVIGKDRCVYRVQLIEVGASDALIRGWEMVYEAALYGLGKVCMGQNEKDECVLLTFSPEQNRGMVINLHTHEKCEFPFAPDQYYRFPDFLFYQGSFHLHSRTVSFRISTQGKVTQEQLPRTEHPDYAAFSAAYDDYTRKLREYTAKLPVSENYLRKVYRMGVSPSGYLVVNKHELRMTDNMLVWKPTAPPQLKYTATQRNDVFSFGPRYTVRNTGSGMLVLTDSLGERVYIPLAMDRSIGIASATHFAGNQYYKRNGMFNQPNTTLQLFWNLYFKEFINSVSA